MKVALSLCASITLFFCSVALADNPVDGTWQLNPAKSQLAGDTITFEDSGNGALKFSNSDESYTFKPDGSTFTTPLTGLERTFKRNSDGSYTSTAKNRGLLLRTTTWKPSSDGNTLMVESKGTKPNGDAFETTEKYVRTAPGAGLVGGWKGTLVKVSSPNALTFQTTGDDVTITISAMKAIWHGKWDGKDYPATGPTVPERLTVALTRVSPNSFKLVQKINGKAVAIVGFRIATDGKTMTGKGTNGEGKEPYTELYEKQ
jgi:hypothetical protein